MDFTWKQAETLSPGKLAIESLELATKTWAQFVKFVLVAVAGLLAIGLISGILAAVLPGWLSGLVMFVAFVLYYFTIFVGGVRLSLAVVDGKKLTLNEIFAYDNKIIGALILAAILYVLAVGVGLIAFVIPGIMIAVGCMFFLYVMLDKQVTGPVQALKASWAIANGDLLNILLLQSAMGLILYAAILPIYEIGFVLMMLAGFFKEMRMEVLIVIPALLGLALAVIVVCAFVVISIGGSLSYAMAYRKLSQTRATAMEAALKS